MNEAPHPNPIDRRTLFAMGGLGAALIAGLAAGGKAAELSSDEAANVKLVNDFCQAWGGPHASADALVSFMADDCVYKTGNKTYSGKDEVKARYVAFLPPGQTYELKILETLAKGPVVVVVRHDYSILPEKTRELGHVGIFIIREGKIQEWNDVGYTLA
jgi:limonene-1,2-epoxide hydrolase